MIVIAVCAVICCADSWADVADFGHAKRKWFETFLDLPHGIPSTDTFERIFARHGARIVGVRNRMEDGDVERVRQMRIDRRFGGMTPQQLAVTYSEMLMSFGECPTP